MEKRQCEIKHRWLFWRRTVFWISDDPHRSLPGDGCDLGSVGEAGGCESSNLANRLCGQLKLPNPE